MKINRLAGLLVLIFLLLFTAACGKDGNPDETMAQTGASAALVDIVSEVAEDAREQNKASLMEDDQKKNYIVLLDGCSDQTAGYYLYDVTGNGSPELMIGNDMMTVYSYNQGSVMTIGTLAVQEVYLSEEYGLLAYCENEGTYELRQYQYDGEMMVEKVLASASNTADYDSQAAGYMDGICKLERYELTDRTPFE